MMMILIEIRTKVKFKEIYLFLPSFGVGGPVFDVSVVSVSNCQRRSPEVGSNKVKLQKLPLSNKQS